MKILNPVTDTWPKIEIFKIQDGCGRHLENRFLAINHRPIVRFQQNFVWGSRTAGQQGLRDKNCKFLKSNMVDGRHLKIVKSPYLSEKLSDFDKIWYTASDIEPGYSHVTKNWNFWNSRWLQPPSRKSFFGHKSSTDCPISAKFCTRKQNGRSTRATGQKLQIFRIQHGGRPPFRKS